MLQVYAIDYYSIPTALVCIMTAPIVICNNYWLDSAISFWIVGFVVQLFMYAAALSELMLHIALVLIGISVADPAMFEGVRTNPPFSS